MRVVAFAVFVGWLAGGCIGLQNFTGNWGAGGLDVGKARGAYATQDDKVVFILLADECNGCSASAAPSRNSGELHALDGREIAWSCRTRDGRSGQATIDGVDYDLANGCVFLVSTRGKNPNVQQLRREVTGLTSFGVEPKIAEWAEVDPEIKKFVKSAEGK